MSVKVLITEDLDFKNFLNFEKVTIKNCTLLSADLFLAEGHKKPWLKVAYEQVEGISATKNEQFLQLVKPGTEVKDNADFYKVLSWENEIYYLYIVKN